MHKNDVQKWLDQYGEAWVNGDPEQIITLFADTATYQETPFDEPMKGCAAIKQYWQNGAAESQSDVQFSSQVWAVEQSFAIAGWQASFTRKATGVRVELDGTFRLVFSSGSHGLVCEHLQEWWHKRAA